MNVPVRTLSKEEVFAWFLRLYELDVDNNPHLIDTPARVARMYDELLKGYKEPTWKFTTFPVKGTPSLVTVCNTSYYSLCSHHCIPFFGVAHVAYLPNKKLCGLSKIARAVRHFAARLQVQEELTEQIAEFLSEKLEPDALAVMMTGQHLCMSMRGVKCPGHNTVTSAMRGKFIRDVGLKEEFLKIIELSK